MNTYLLEIGVEELPAKQLTRVMRGFKDSITAELEKEKLIYSDLHVWSTPRRIAVYIEGIADRLADEQVVVFGPNVTIAYKDGVPTPALLGFLKKNDAKTEDVVVTTKGKNDVVALNTVVTGIGSKSVISRLASGWVTGAAFDKSMRWRDYNIQFSRPIRWIVSLYNSEHLPVLIEGLQSDVYTCGHRTLANRKFKIPEAQAYLSVMDEAKIMVDHNARRESILSQISDLESLYTVTAEKDEFLLDEIINIVEYPTVFAAHFDKEFLSLPIPVITTPMKGHQRYFPAFVSEQELSNVFLGVRNGDDFCLDVVAKGNEKVLLARLKDAQFFFDEDSKRRLEDFINGLKTVVYQVKLGTIYEKVERINALSGYIADMAGLSEEQRTRLHRAVYLSKADLNTSMVNEFDELQGVMGKIYAERDGENLEVCRAIESHYLPRFSGDKTPLDIIGRIISIADKMDSLVGSYGIEIAPRGSKDPFGLRRLMISILTIVLENKSEFNPNLDAVISQSAALTKDRFSLPADSVVEQVRDAMLQRLRGIMNDKGYRYDIIEAGIETSLCNLSAFVARCDALTAYDKSNLEAVTTNIMRAIKLSSDAKAGLSVNTDLFDVSAETILFESALASSQKIDSFATEKNFLSALIELELLSNSIATFLDDVMVMHENIIIRENRIQLMRFCADVAAKVADFSRLQIC